MRRPSTRLQRISLPFLFVPALLQVEMLLVASCKLQRTPYRFFSCHSHPDVRERQSCRGYPLPFLFVYRTIGIPIWQMYRLHRGFLTVSLHTRSVSMSSPSASQVAEDLLTVSLRTAAPRPNHVAEDSTFSLCTFLDGLGPLRP